MLLKKNDTVVFVGDSITDCGRKRPEGEGAPASNPFGNGFASLVFAYLHSKYPSLHIRVINQGIGGNKSNDVLERYDEVLTIKADWVFLMIGVNDVWRKFDCPEIESIHITLEQFKKNVAQIIKNTLEINTKIVLLSPFIIEKNKNDEIMQELIKYQNVLRDLAKTYNLAYIDIQKDFDKLLEDISTYELSRDRIHPNITGHFLIMQSIINFLESN